MRPSPPSGLIVFQCIVNQLHCSRPISSSLPLLPLAAACQCSEQLYEPLLVGSVPVYFGAPNAADFAPQNSFINATQFDGPVALGAHLVRLLKEPSLLAKYHAWRADTDEVNRFLVFAKVRVPTYACADLCLVTTY